MNDVNELNMNTDWNNILELIKDKKFEIKYSNYIFHRRESGYLIMEKESKNKDKNEGVKEVEKEEKIYKDVDEKIDGKKDADDKTDKNNKIKRKKFFLFEEKKKIKIYFSSIFLILKNFFSYYLSNILVKFGPYQFQIEPIFPFMQNIINYEYTETECYNFFKNELYKKDLIANNLIKGDYFEASAKFELRKLKLLKNNDSINITLNEIVSMDEIIQDKNKYYVEVNEEKTLTETKEIKNEFEKSLINKSIDQILKDDIKKDKKDNIEEEVEKEIEEEEEEEKEEEIEESKIICGEEFKKLLKKFGIDYKKKNLDNTYWNGLSKEAQNLLKSIEDYRLDEVKEQIKKKQKFTPTIYTGNESIFLDQFSKFGKTLDFAYLYGNKNEKVFIGFQMKCYFESSYLDEKFINKLNIKKNCRKILVNSMKLFNCKITNWHYYIIFYYNKKNINENINMVNLARCNLYNIGYFFYEPIEKEFYMKTEKRYVKINDLTMNENSNLEINVTDISKYSYVLNEKRKLVIGKNMDGNIISFINDLSKALNIKNENPDILKILSIIKEKIGMEEYNLLFHAKIPFNKGLISPKYDDYILLYKTKMIKGIIDFIAAIKENENIKYIQISTGNQIENKLYDILDEDSKYYYCLFKYSKVAKRNYMELLNTTLKKK